MEELVEALNAGTADKEHLGRVLHSTVAESAMRVAAVEARSVEVAHAHEVWEQQRFHAVRVNIKVQGESQQAPGYTVGDTGAAPSLYPLKGLSVEVQNSSIRPRRARLLNALSIGA